VAAARESAAAALAAAAAMHLEVQVLLTSLPEKALVARCLVLQYVYKKRALSC
jgi:hypothetical protein